MATKDWLPLVISIAALSVSGTVAYRTMFREAYELQAIIVSGYPDYGDTNGLVDRVDFSPDIVIVNNGNRPLGVTGLVLRTYQVSQLRPTCNVDSQDLIHSIDEYPTPETFQPTVISPYDIKVLRPEFVTATAPDTGNVRVHMSRALRQQQGVLRLQTCLSVEFSVPGEGIRSIQSLLSYTLAGRDRGLRGVLAPHGNGVPVILIDESRARFW